MAQNCLADQNPPLEEKSPDTRKGETKDETINSTSFVFPGGTYYALFSVPYDS